MKRPNPLKLAAILILAFSAASCTPYWAKGREDKFAKCPGVELLGPTRGWIDPVGDGWQVRGQIAEYAVECKLTKTAANITITATVDMERNKTLNPGNEAKISLPMFIAVMRGDDILSKNVVAAPMTFDKDKQQFEKQVELPVNLNFIKLDPPPAAASDSADDSKDKDKAKDKKPKENWTASDRTIIFGFQLTPQQLDYFQHLRDAPAAAALQAK